MSEPRRLLDGDGGGLERSLLRSARGDAPAAKSRRKALVALGLAGGVGGATTATATSTAAVALKGSAAVGGATLVKWIGVGVLTGAVVIGAATVAPKKAPARAPVTMGETPKPPAQPASTVPVASPNPPAAPTQAEPPHPPPSSPSPGAAPSDEPAPKPVTMQPAAAAPVAQPAATSLTYEVAALDRAREALAAGDAGGALRALDDHDRRFPGGMLGPEATVLRIEALALRGDRASAVRLGKAFLDAHPRSPHASRLRSLLGLDAPAPPSPPNPVGPKPPAAAP